METLGTVVEITCDGRVIIRCEKVPDIGDAVFSGDRTVGKIGKVFGPINEPYASVTLSGKSSANIGSVLFFKGGETSAKRKRGSRRD